MRLAGAALNPALPLLNSTTMANHLDKIEADRQAQHSGYGVRKFHAVGGIIKWEAYGWERITELTTHYTSYALFDHKWEAEQYFFNIING